MKYYVFVQVAILGDSSEAVVELAYQYGKNTGIAFQVSRFHIINKLCKNVGSKTHKKP